MTRRQNRRQPDEQPEHPDIEAAQAELKRIKDQRPRVARLVAALLAEQMENNFAANVFGPTGRQS